MTTGPGPLRLGNDVVDLGHPLCAWDAPRRDRFLERVLDERERAWVAGADEDERARRLWCAWAAKEAAYKAACKLSGEGLRPVFRPSAFGTVLVLAPSPPDLCEVGGEVRFDGRSVRISGWASPQLVHVAGLCGGDEGPIRLEMGVERIPREDLGGQDGWRERLRPRFTDREWEGVHGPEAAWARLLAKARLAGYLGGDGGDDPLGDGDGDARVGAGPGEASTRSGPRRIEILTSRERPGRTPPRVLVDGEPVRGLDLSLSHHGEYASWALLLPAGAGGRRGRAA